MKAHSFGSRYLEWMADLFSDRGQDSNPCAGIFRPPRELVVPLYHGAPSIYTFLYFGKGNIPFMCFGINVIGFCSVEAVGPLMVFWIDGLKSIYLFMIFFTYFYFTIPYLFIYLFYLLG